MKRPEKPLEAITDAWDPRDEAFWLRELREGCRELKVAWTGLESGKRGRQARWLATYARTGAKSRANGFAEISRMTFSRWTREDPIFGPLVPYAQEALADLYVAEMTRRAVDGVSTSIRDKNGHVIGEERKYSDALLIHLTKGLDPEKRWAKAAEQVDPNGERWRQVFAKIKDDPAMLAALDLIADAAVGGAEGSP